MSLTPGFELEPFEIFSGVNIVLTRAKELIKPQVILSLK